MPTENRPTLNFEILQPFEARRFVPMGNKLNSLDEIKPLIENLLNRKVTSLTELEQWLIDRSELEAALDQVGSILYIRMTCQTDNAQYTQAYTDFIQNIVPVLKPLSDQLNKKFLEDLKSHPFNHQRYDIYIRELKSEVGLYREENVPLQTQVELLSQEYQTVCGAMTVSFEGKEQTLPQMTKYLLEPNRSLREAAWKATAKRRLVDKEKLDQIFDQMLILRHKTAINAGCKNFCEYKFISLNRFDYTSQDCKTFHETVEKIILPIHQKILERRKKEMGLEILKPWDLAVDSLGRNPLKPFEKVEDLIGKCAKIFQKLDSQLGQQYQDMIDNGLLDLESRRGKAPGGYQSNLSEVRKPFIFMNAVGVDDDVRTLLHEAGHAFHSMASRTQTIASYRHGPMEFNEVASMSMELLAGKYLSMFYDSQSEQRSNTLHFEEIVSLLIWVATIDCFQHWIYENPAHSSAERKEQWLQIRERFGGNMVDWSGFDEEQGYLWHRQLHIFEVPFYYIEYGIAQLGALQIWMNAKKDAAKALEFYKNGLSLGGSKPLPELFTAAGIRFDFSESTIAPLMVEVVKEIGL